jgi:hypothetical protein
MKLEYFLYLNPPLFARKGNRSIIHRCVDRAAKMPDDAKRTETMPAFRISAASSYDK